MNRSMLAAAISVFFAVAPVGAANAEPIFNWTGFYVGVHGGYGWGDYRVADDNPSVNYRLEPRGFMGGAQAGYNLQLGNVVVGLEADIAYGDISARSSNVALVDAVGFEADRLASVRGRAGLAISNLLLYGTIGYGWIHWQDTQELGGVPWEAQPNRKRAGLVLGAGSEYALSPNWSFKIEYLRYNFGEWDDAGDTFWGIGADHFDLHIDTIKIGVNYRFNTGSAR